MEKEKWEQTGQAGRDNQVGQAERVGQMEQIGKVTLDYTHYPGEDYYCDGDVEEELLDIAKTYGKVEFPRIIEERKSWPILYHLSSIRENIVDWLPMDKSMKVLEVGSGCGAITGSLAKKAGEVTCIDLSGKRSLINAWRNAEYDNVTIHVGNFQDIEPHLPRDYDYVCLIGVFEYGQSYIGGETPFHDFYRIVKRHVKNNGRLVIAIENKFGLKYWAGCREDHLGSFFSGIEDYPEGGGVRTFSRKGLEDILSACGEKEYCFYYPYPDYKFMTTLFSDRRLPKVGELSDNLRNFDRDRLLLFDEKNVFDAMIREGMFPFYSNSYMVVVGEMPRVEYCRYSNDRTYETAIRTEVSEQDGVKRVRKLPLTEFGVEHIRSMQDAYDKLSRRYAGGRLAINKCRLQEENGLPCAEFEYVTGVTLSELLDECLLKGDVEGFRKLFAEYVERIDYGSEEKITDYDMIFSNILVQGDTWTVIDYEWTGEVQTDTKEIAFRSLYCYLLENENRNRCDMGWALEYLGISPEEARELQEQEAAFQSKVTGKRLSMPQLRELIGGSVFAPVKWMDKIEESAGKDRVQIYEDFGSGFSEENSYFVEETHTGERRLEMTLSVSGNVRRLRIDPAMDSCICKILEFTVNGKPVPLNQKQILETNGQMAKGQARREDGGLNLPSIVFATTDPNMTLHLKALETEAENEICLTMEVVRLSAELCADMEYELKRKIRL